MSERREYGEGFRVRRGTLGASKDEASEEGRGGMTHALPGCCEITAESKRWPTEWVYGYIQ